MTCPIAADRDEWQGALDAAFTRIEQLEQQCAERAMLAHRWMVAHDFLKAGKPYDLPRPADLPEALASFKAREDAIKAQVAELYCASGCSCCRDDDRWYAASEALGKLLDAPAYADGSGVDWYAVRYAARAHTAAEGGE